MGIRDFSLLYRKYPAAVETVPLSAFAGRRIAIDGNNWLWVIWSTTYKDVLATTDVGLEDPDPTMVLQKMAVGIRQSVDRFLSAGIRPVFVFDGAYPPEKQQTQSDRRAKKEQGQVKLNELRTSVRGLDPLMQTTEHLEALRKAFRNAGYLTSSEIQSCQVLLRGIGLPILIARYEAEQLCSMLAIEGQVEAVLSTDSDVLVYGCPVALTGFTTIWLDSERVEAFTVIRLANLLQQTHLTFTRFVDMCILSGCDYNQHLPRVSMATSYKLIQRYGSIEGLVSHYDITPLNHRRCRDLFRYVRSSSLCSSSSLDPDLEILRDNGREILDWLGLGSWLGDLIQSYQALPLGRPSAQRPPRLVRLRMRKE